MSILVVGDAIIDKHTQGEVTRISPEAPVPVVNAGSDSKYSLGAAANVAAQIAAANIPCLFAYRSFDSDPDKSHERLANMCMDKKVKPRPLQYPTICFPVTTKERIWAEGQQLCRIDREYTNKPNRETEESWCTYIESMVTASDVKVVVFSDYDKGTLTDFIIQRISDYCFTRGIKTILDPKRYSYWGLQNLTVIKPNSREVKITNMPVEEVSEHLGNTLLLNTLGKDGMKLWQNGEEIHKETIYTHGRQVIDVCGCGDTVSAFLAIAYYQGLPIQHGMEAASEAAAVNTRHRGCYVLNKLAIDTIFRSLPVHPITEKA